MSIAPAAMAARLAACLSDMMPERALRPDPKVPHGIGERFSTMLSEHDATLRPRTSPVDESAAGGVPHVGGAGPSFGDGPSSPDQDRAPSAERTADAPPAAFHAGASRSAGAATASEAKASEAKASEATTSGARAGAGPASRADSAADAMVRLAGKIAILQPGAAAYVVEIHGAAPLAARVDQGADGRIAVSLSLPGADPAQRRRMARELARHLDDRGCGRCAVRLADHL